MKYQVKLHENRCEKQSLFCMKLYVKYHVFILGIRNPADNSIIIDQNLLNIKITWEIAMSQSEIKNNIPKQENSIDQHSQHMKPLVIYLNQPNDT
jgi:hypothetical protein